MSFCSYFANDSCWRYKEGKVFFGLLQLGGARLKPYEKPKKTSLTVTFQILEISWQRPNPMYLGSSGQWIYSCFRL
jgi:hypothetical protein